MLTTCKEVAILESVNEEYREKNKELKAKRDGLEVECSSVTEDVLAIKTQEEQLRTEFQLYKRKVLYGLSRVDLSLVGIKPNLKDFDKLIDTVSTVIKKQKAGYHIVLDQIQKAMLDSDLQI